MRLSTLPTSILLCLALLVPLTVLGSGTAVAAELPPGGTFTDDDASVHEPNIEAIAAQGITNGCASGRFCPYDSLSRGEMAAFLQRALGLPRPQRDHFRDDERSPFEDAINSLADAGITNGCGNGTGFCPEHSVTRAEMAAFLRRGGDLPAGGSSGFVDVAGGFEDDINAIAAAGITAGCTSDNSRFCPGQATTREQMATFLTRFLGLTPIDPPDAASPRDMSAREAIAHWFPNREGQALDVARCESSLNPRAVNHSGGWHGLFQIAKRYHESNFERVTGVSWSSGIYTAYYNAEYARHLYGSQGWGPWGCRP